MRQIPALFLFLLLVGSALSVRANEFSIRAAPQLGVLGLINNTALGGAANRYTFVSEFHMEYQVKGRWFATVSLHTIHFLDKVGGYMNVFAPAAGVKLVSFEDVVASGDFFDQTRWWFELEGGPYLHQARFGAVIPRGDHINFGFSAGGGFDTLFHKRWAAGLQTKMHYVNFGPDDYILVHFGPHLMFRFY